MTKETVLEKVQHQKPRLMFLSGKTCTGKTTFANYLEQHGYEKIELDKIVVESIVVPFGAALADGFRIAYRDEGSAEQTNAFIAATKLEIRNRLLESALVIEGAIANPRILREIFSDDLKDFLFVYFHPIHADVYEQRIFARFMAGAKTGSAGLPKEFWELVQESDLEEFKNTDNINKGIKAALAAFAVKSMEESKSRLEGFRGIFPDIVVVEI